MLLESALFTYLSTYAGITALIGARVYHIYAPPQATKPYLTYQRLGSEFIDVFGDTITLRKVSIGVAAIATTDLEAATLRVQVMTALHSYSGMMGGGAGVKVHAAIANDISEDFDFETKTYIVPMEFLVWAEEGI